MRLDDPRGVRLALTKPRSVNVAQLALTTTRLRLWFPVASFAVTVTVTTGRALQALTSAHRFARSTVYAASGEARRPVVGHGGSLAGPADGPLVPPGTLLGTPGT